MNRVDQIGMGQRLAAKENHKGLTTVGADIRR